MELDFGPAEPPSQPPKNIPPSEGTMGTTQSASSPAPVPLDSSASGGLAQGKPSAPPVPPLAQGAPVAHAGSVPVKPKGGGRKILLALGVVIIVLGLGYLGFTLLAQQGAPDDTASLGVETITPAATETTPLTEVTPTPTVTPTTTATAPITLETSSPATETIQTRDTIRKKDLATIQTYLESYFNDKASYPISTKLAKLNDSTSSATTALVPKYTSALPRDPKDPAFFYGYKSVDGKTYALSAQLENTADSEGKLEGSVYLYTVSK